MTAIIAAYNASAFVSEAIQSALASTDVNLEVIVVDDQSTDNTWAILQSFGSAIRAVRQEKGGPYRARNLGARLATGEWLAFLDADDQWLPEKLSRQLAIAQSHGELVYTECTNFGSIDRVSERQSESTTFYEGDVFEPLLLNNFISLSSVMIRKASFEHLGGFSEIQKGVLDWDLWLRFAASGGIARVVREPLTRYRIHAGQMTQDLDARAADRASVIERALASPRGSSVSARIARQARANVWQTGAWTASTIDRGKAIRWYLRAARHWPWNVTLYKELAKCCLHRG